MKKILTFTDLHMRDEGQTIIGLDPYRQFQDGLAHALENHSDADHVILMGDLANSGKTSEYERVRKALADCPLPVTFMAGNHDNRENMRVVFGDLPTTDQGHLQRVVDLGSNRIITLDSLDGPPFRNDFHNGVLCEHRLAWLENVLQNSTDKRVCVFIHHGAFKIGLDGLDAIRLCNDTEFIRLLRRYPCVEHLCCGHIHRSISGSAQGLGFTVFKSTCHQMPLILGAGYDSMSVAEPAAYGVVLFLDDAIIVHSEDWPVSIHDAQHQPDVLPE
ncbi:MAG: phosphodiesterase [Rhodobacteraceae bacterium]|nr:phosphodiesterase [Paracoccaceae bacterium]